MTTLKPFLLVISSPSGAGKTTLCQKLLEEFPNLTFSISTTTRPKRENEEDGKDYFFVTQDKFQELIEQNAFVEWFEVHNNRYGTTHDEINKSRDPQAALILDVDYRGSAKIKVSYPEAVTIQILPPSMEELERRIRSRATDSEEQVQIRLRNARQEIERYQQFDFIIVNDKVSDAYEKLRSIYISERCRSERSDQEALTLLG